MIAAFLNGVFLLVLIFGSLLWVHRYDAYRWWVRFGEAIREDAK